MVSGGFLTAVPDQDLAVHLADLYEHWHPRIETNGALADEISIDSYKTFIDNWDLDRRSFLNTGSDAMVRAKNAVRMWKEYYCDWYAGMFLPEFLVTVQETRRELESFLED